MEETENERGPSQLADVTNVALVWSQCSKLRRAQGREEVARDQV